jgi:hypothetical protein
MLLRVSNAKYVDCYSVICVSFEGINMQILLLNMVHVEAVDTAMLGKVTVQKNVSWSLLMQLTSLR